MNNNNSCNTCGFPMTGVNNLNQTMNTANQNLNAINSLNNTLENNFTCIDNLRAIADSLETNTCNCLADVNTLANNLNAGLNGNNNNNRPGACGCNRRR